MGGPLVSVTADLRTIRKTIERVERGRHLHVPKLRCRLIREDQVSKLSAALVRFRDSLPEGPRGRGDLLADRELLARCHPLVVVFEPVGSRKTGDDVEAFFLGAPYRHVKDFLGLRFPPRVVPLGEERIFYMSDVFADPYLRGRIGAHFQGIIYQVLNGQYNWILFSSSGSFLNRLERCFQAAPYATDQWGNQFYLLAVRALRTRAIKPRIGPTATVIRFTKRPV